MSRAAGRGWSRAELAKRADVGISSVQAIEEQDGAPEIGAGLDATRDYRVRQRAAVVAKIVDVLKAAGVTLLPDRGAGEGARVKPR